MRIVVDGVFFQLASSGIARVWASLLPRLAARGATVILLDRGGCPSDTGARHVPFPSWHDHDTATDTQLIQEACDRAAAGLFVSTYYTRPRTTPSLLLVHDMIPELFGFDLTERSWVEKRAALAAAAAYVAVSNSTAHDLLTIHPAIPALRVTVAQCGVDHATFRPRAPSEVEAFRRTHGLARRYFLLVGTRRPQFSYKNSELFFDALPGWERRNYDVLCVGGEAGLDPALLARLPHGVNAKQVVLNDADLAAAYTDAEALVYPSRYEGFGLPVAEAMACGCPVITTLAGSLPEVAGNAALILAGRATADMQAALAAIADVPLRERLRRAGLAQAARFDWDRMADRMMKAARRVTDGSGGVTYHAGQNAEGHAESRRRTLGR